jgi:CHAT domain-containing protein
VLIPKGERVALSEGKYKTLIVFPDAALATLPFETLVVKSDGNPRYLLDVGPPIQYAPSATILLNLAKRPVESSASDTEPVLTVGEPLYFQPSQASEETALAQATPRSRYAGLRGNIEPLPFTGWETTWVSQTFKQSGIAVAYLRGDAATEAAVRHNAQGRRILHLACHGLVDQAHGNLFGALALTPGADATKPGDDGFLTLAEIYELNLKGCELSILSACDTNVGPQQRGEGVWALSRGFLVAGSRRVVASNWLVDDEAAATLIYWFCGFLAEAEKKGQPLDYAAALQRAKQAVRQQEKWSSPYYWGTFVLVGPN